MPEHQLALFRRFHHVAHRVNGPHAFCIQDHAAHLFWKAAGEDTLPWGEPLKCLRGNWVWNGTIMHSPSLAGYSDIQNFSFHFRRWDHTIVHLYNLNLLNGLWNTDGWWTGARGIFKLLNWHEEKVTHQTLRCWCRRNHIDIWCSHHLRVGHPCCA